MAALIHPELSLLQTEGASPPFTARVPSSASAYDQRGLAPGQEYQVTVRALRGTNWGPPASKTITTSESWGCCRVGCHGCRMDLKRGGWDMPSKRAEGRDWLGARLLAGQLVTENQTPT